MKDRFLHPDRQHDVGEQFLNNHQTTRCILARENNFERNQVHPGLQERQAHSQLAKSKALSNEHVLFRELDERSSFDQNHIRREKNIVVRIVRFVESESCTTFSTFRLYHDHTSALYIVIGIVESIFRTTFSTFRFHRVHMGTLSMIDSILSQQQAPSTCPRTS